MATKEREVWRYVAHDFEVSPLGRRVQFAVFTTEATGVVWHTRKQAVASSRSRGKVATFVGDPCSKEGRAKHREALKRIEEETP